MLILGLIAGTLTSLCSIPQIIRIWKTKSATDVSTKMFFVLSLGVALWIVYGILKDDIAIIATNSASLVFNITVLALKKRFS